mmetsp:Transcript_7593/g.21752  ORF Transcript_7593/g.21752 Transcript_7593/m.21752 type:complete len:311 (-) Transcript_7593:384-1316(-)
MDDRRHAPLSPSSFSLRSISLRFCFPARLLTRLGHASAVMSFAASPTLSSFGAEFIRAPATSSTPSSSRQASLRFRCFKCCWVCKTPTSAPAVSGPRMLSCRSRETRFFPIKAPASLWPPSCLTREETIIKSSMQGVSWISLAMEKAPSLSLMLLYRCSLFRVPRQARRSWIALHAATEHPMFLNAMPLKDFWLVSAVAQARMPFSPRALSLRSRDSSSKPSTASQRHLSDFMASSSGLPAITSLKSRSTSVSRHVEKASAATAAASTPKLFVLSLILLTPLLEALKMGPKSSFAVSAVTNSLFPSHRSR